uniref:Uncharacterized protein n=1 Tax=Anguilla anguilla TaxID=7936 RepID=A0A0E9QR72_ANGAN
MPMNPLQFRRVSRYPCCAQGTGAPNGIWDVVNCTSHFDSFKAQLFAV